MYTKIHLSNFLRDGPNKKITYEIGYDFYFNRIDWT